MLSLLQETDHENIQLVRQTPESTSLVARCAKTWAIDVGDSLVGLLAIFSMCWVVGYFLYVEGGGGLVMFDGRCAVYGDSCG